MIFVVNVARVRKQSSSYTTAGSLGCKSHSPIHLDIVVSTSKAVATPIIMPVIAKYASKIVHYARIMLSACSNKVIMLDFMLA